MPSPMNDDMSAPSATLWLMMSAATMDSCDVPYFSNKLGHGRLKTLTHRDRILAVAGCPGPEPDMVVLVHTQIGDPPDRR